MAFNLRQVVSVTLTVEDKSGTSTTGFYVGDNAGNPIDVTNPAFGTFVTEYAASMQNAMDCRVTQITAQYTWIQDTLPAFGGDPNVERKGILQFRTADGFYTTVSIPGIKSAAVSADGVNLIRDANTPGQFTGSPIETHLEGIHDKLRNGVTVGVLNFPVVDRRGADLRDLVDAYQQHRANTRG